VLLFPDEMGQGHRRQTRMGGTDAGHWDRTVVLQPRGAAPSQSRAYCNNGVTSTK